MDELLPSVDELFTPVAGAAPIAVVPVDGAAAIEVEGRVPPKVDEPKVDEPEVDEPTVDEPTVDELSVEEFKVDEFGVVVEFSADDPVADPQGAPTPGLRFCANAPPAHAATAPATNSCASDFIGFSFG